MEEEIVEFEAEVDTEIVAEKEATLSGSLLQAYMKDVNKFPLLSEQEAKRITTEYAASQGPRLRAKLINHNLRLVVKIAYEYRAAYSNLMDLIQEGNIGLIKGVEKFDPSRGVPLAHYAANWIRAYMLRFIVNNSRLVKLGTTEAQRKLFFNLAKEKAKLEAQGIEVTDALLASRLNVEEKELTEMGQRLSAPDASIHVDSGSHRDSGSNPVKILSIEAEDANPDEAFEKEERKKQIYDRLMQFRTSLPAKKAVVFDRRLMQDEPDTLEEIGVDLQVTRQRVQQIEAEIKSKLQSFLKNV